MGQFRKKMLLGIFLLPGYVLAFRLLSLNWLLVLLGAFAAILSSILAARYIHERGWSLIRDVENFFGWWLIIGFFMIGMLVSKQVHPSVVGALSLICLNVCLIDWLGRVLLIPPAQLQEG